MNKHQIVRFNLPTFPFPVAKLQPCRKLFVISISIFLIASCASSVLKPLPRKPETQQWQADVNTFPHHHWQLRGKIAFFGKKKQSANIFWQRQFDDYKLNLTSFLGTQVLTMESKNSQLVLSADGKVYQNDQARYMVNQITGLNMPVEQALTWLTINVPGKQLSYTADGLPQSYSPKENWHISYKKFKSFANQHGHWYLPTELDFRSPQGRIKLRINEWIL